LERSAEPGIAFEGLPPDAAKPRSYTAWNRSFTNWLFQSQQLSLLKSPSLGQISKPAEAERDFRIRLQQVAREERDRLAETLKQKYAPKLASLAERKRRAEAAVEQQKGQRSQALLQTAVTVGSGLLSAFLGRKALSATTVSKASTAARQMGRSWQQMQDVDQANESAEQIDQQVAELQKQFEAELASQQAKIDPDSEQFQTINVRLKKTNIEVQLVALAWRAS